MLDVKYRIIVKKDDSPDWKIFKDNMSLNNARDSLGQVLMATRRPWLLQQATGSVKKVPAYNLYMIIRRLDEDRTLEAFWYNKDLGLMIKIQEDI